MTLDYLEHYNRGFMDFCGNFRLRDISWVNWRTTGRPRQAAYEILSPCLAFGVGRLLHLPSAEAISVRPNARPQMFTLVLQYKYLVHMAQIMFYSFANIFKLCWSTRRNEGNSRPYYNKTSNDVTSKWEVAWHNYRPLWQAYSDLHPIRLLWAPQLTPVRGIKCIPPRDVWLISSGGIPKSSDQDTSPVPPSNSTLLLWTLTDFLCCVAD